MHETDYLAKRGIAKAAQEMQWEFYPLTIRGKTYAGYRFPIFDLNGNPVKDRSGELIYRWKNTSGDNSIGKNRWMNPTRTVPKFYFPPGIRAAIRRNNGSLLYPEGEPDLLSMLEAGVENVLTGTSGTTISEEMIDLLQDLQVKRIIHFPDLDEAGRASAAKLGELLAETDIEYRPVLLPEELGKKGDINDLWCREKFSRKNFRTILLDRVKNHPLTFQAEDSWQEPVRPRSKQHEESGTRDLPQNYLQDITQGLGVKKYRPSGWSENFCCPFHEDQNPSASWNKKLNCFNCFVCGAFNAKEVGRRLGLNLKDYYTDQRPSKKKAQKASGSLSESGGEGQPEPNKQRKATHDELGDYIIQRWGVNIAYFYGEIHIYNDGLWSPYERIGDELWDALIAHKPMGIKPTETVKKSVLSYLQDRLLVSQKLLDAGNDYINLRNGLLNLQTLELESYRRDLYLTSQLDFDYDPQATSPTWDRFIAETFSGNTRIIDLLHEAIGYSLTGDTRHETSFWLYGEGATGKSTVLRVIYKLAGNAATSFNIGALNHDPYQVATLAGKRVYITSETNVDATLADGLLKGLISGETIHVRDIREKGFNMEPIGKIWTATNHLPKNNDRSNGMYRRMKIITFPNQVAQDRRDITLAAKLAAELPGIFNRAMEGLHRLKQQGHFTQVDEVEAAVAEYREINDIEKLFLDDPEMILMGDGLITKSSDLMLAHKVWRDMNSHKPKPSNQLGKDWERLGLLKKKTKDCNYYVGVGLTDKAQKMVNHHLKQKGDDLEHS